MYIFNLSLNEAAIDMAMIEITIRDDHGNVIGGQAGRKYKLDLGNKSFNEIERAVGILKNVALPDLRDCLKTKALNFNMFFAKIGYESRAEIKNYLYAE